MIGEQGAVLGASVIDFSGTPLIPPEVVTWYFVIFLTILSVVYFILHKKHKPVYLRHKVKLLIVITVVLKLFVVLGGGLLAAYWLLPRPHIEKTSPAQESTNHAPTQKIEIIFDKPVSRRTLTKKITPEVPGIWRFENSVYGTHLYRRLVFYPTLSLKPETTYKIELGNIQNILKFSHPYAYSYSFTTQKTPDVKSVTPSNGNTNFPANEKILVELTESNDQIGEFDFTLTPSHPLDVELAPDKESYTLRPRGNLKHDTFYNLTIKRTNIVYNLPQNLIVERGETKELYNGSFITGGTSPAGNILPTLGSPKSTGFYPQDGWDAVSVTAPIKVTFDQEVNHESAQARFTILPKVEGSFSWEGNTMIFTPRSPLSFSTKYQVAVATGVRSKIGFPSTKAYEARFTSQEETVKLAVPAYLQQHTLSCELAALRMALKYRGVDVSEERLLDEVGVDWTPHKGNVWGDPHEKFVGNVDGTQMADGYGVHWRPIARVARKYRNAKEFEGWSVKELTEAISQGNPVVIWTYSGGGWPTTWYTPSGKEIKAARDEHAVTAVGYVGPAGNPSQLIINDPLIGQVYWPRSFFDSKWALFGQSGVVVY